MDHKNIISYIYGNETSHVQNDDNDMHEGLLDPINISPFGNIKKKRRGIDSLKVEEVEKETQNEDMPSSPHVDSPDGSQYD